MIPKTAHFVWLGREFPWAYGLALRSAALRGGFEKVVLHCSDDLGETRGWRLAADLDAVEARPLEPGELLGELGEQGAALEQLLARLTQPAARSNLLRAAILAREGGVYLDTDVVTVRPFEPLLGVGVFCGAERIALPATLVRSRAPHRWIAAGARIAMRDLLRRAPGGWRAFRKIERLYPAAVNNAVLGATPGHPFLLEMLDRMLRLPSDRQLVRFALGTHLLQDVVGSYAGDDLEVHPPRRFYPLGPEISQHWFRRHRRPLGPVEPLHDDTVAVHWYASVRTREIVATMDEAFVRENADWRLLCRLVAPVLEP